MRTTENAAAALVRYVLVLTTAAALAGCAAGPGRVRPLPDPAHAIGGFVLVVAAEDDGGVQRNSEVNPVRTAAGGAVGVPGAALYVAAHAGSQVVSGTAILSALGPLAAVGLVVGAIHGAARSAEIRRTHGPALDAVQRQLADIALQPTAERAVTAHLKQRFGARFSGSVPPAEMPATGAIDTAFELTPAGVQMRIDRDGNVALIVTAALRVLRLPGNHVLHESTMRYETPKQLSPGLLAEHDGARMREDLDHAWKHFADEIAIIVDRAGSAGGDDAPRFVEAAAPTSASPES